MNKRKKYGLRQVLLKKGQGIATSKVSQERVEWKPKHYIFKGQYYTLIYLRHIASERFRLT